MPDAPHPTTGDAHRATTLRFQGLTNRVTRTLLATPLVSRAVGRRLVTLYVVGRTSFRRLTIPVAYTRHDGDLLVGTPFGWGRNLRTGQPIELRYKGSRRWADVESYTAEADVTRFYADMARDNRQFAAFNKIGTTPQGDPDPEDLRLAWVGGARAFRLTVR